MGILRKHKHRIAWNILQSSISSSASRYRHNLLRDVVLATVSNFAYQVHVVQQESKPDGERLVVMKGAPERIIDRCSEVLLGDRLVPMTPELRAEIEGHQEALSRNGLRVLGYVFSHGGFLLSR